MWKTDFLVCWITMVGRTQLQKFEITVGNWPFGSEQMILAKRGKAIERILQLSIIRQRSRLLCGKMIRIQFQVDIEAIPI